MQITTCMRESYIVHVCNINYYILVLYYLSTVLHLIDLYSFIQPSQQRPQNICDSFL